MISILSALQNTLGEFIDLGGPVVMLLIAMSVLAVAMILMKLWQFWRAGVGRHERILAALHANDHGDHEGAMKLASSSKSHLGELTVVALCVGPHYDHDALRARLTGMAELNMSRLQSGFRLLDSIAQIAPLLGLFGTVLGMIGAFQALQEAGANVDPSALAGGIWVALLTTAMGLGVAMPAALVLTWFESKVAAEGRLAMTVVDSTLCAGLPSAPDHAVMSEARAAANV